MLRKEDQEFTHDRYDFAEYTRENQQLMQVVTDKIIFATADDYVGRKKAKKIRRTKQLQPNGSAHAFQSMLLLCIAPLR
jgi:hypothetical protein